jgi:hypothetical protein
MSALAAVASVGAGASQVRVLNGSKSAGLKDQNQQAEDVRVVALRLITEALAVDDTTGHDLDVLA